MVVSIAIAMLGSDLECQKYLVIQRTLTYVLILSSQSNDAQPISLREPNLELLPKVVSKGR
ncbi:hypothetical protein [Scytonema hofmannii]|uniref:hypothetical protein n=1 Tax=Scytonema hofmannii TaxID=34078 RepID=UPI0011DFF56D|nr:hypothetical protein [Scytonema hofmannii]